MNASSYVGPSLPREPTPSVRPDVVVFVIVCFGVAICGLFACILRRIEQLERPRYVELQNVTQASDESTDPYAENDVDDDGTPGVAVL